MARHAPKALWLSDKSGLKTVEVRRVGLDPPPQLPAPKLLILGVTAATVAVAATAGLLCAPTDQELLRESVSDSWSLLYKPNNSD